MRRNVIADELIMVGLIITQSPQCAHIFPIAVETLCCLIFWTMWTKKKRGVLQMLMFSSMEGTVRVATLPPRNCSPSFHSSCPLSQSSNNFSSSDILTVLDHRQK